MNLRNFMAGLEILRPYFDDPDGYHLGAEHDQIFVFATDQPVSDEDVAKLRELGWIQPDLGEDAPYDPAESWSAFV